MTELQLKLVKNTEGGFMSKAMSNFGKAVYSSGGGLYSLLIGAKRNLLLKAYGNYQEITQIADENKRNTISAKYDKSYENFLNCLEKYIKENIYNKVQKRVSNVKEEKIMSKYYEINALKGNEYVEYKYKRQILLLDMDWENVSASKTGKALQKYKNFYINTMEQIYKASMRHYAIILTDNKNEGIEKYEKIYELIESYIKQVVPYAEEVNSNKKVLEDYKKYVQSLDTYAQKESNELRKKLVLLGLSRELFVYSLPVIAAEQCYEKLLETCRIALNNTFIDADKYELYTLLLDIIEEYNENVLSKKVYWDSQTLREEHNKFWNKYQELKKLARIDYDEYLKAREILFVKYDLKNIKDIKKKYDGVKEYYKTRMVQLHALRRLKKCPTLKNGLWRARRRMQADNIQED